MRILCVHNRYQIRGGEDESFEAELQLLREHGHRVDTYEQNNHCIEDIGPIHRGLRTIWSSQTHREIIQRIRHDAHKILHVQNFFPMISPSVYYAARAAGVPVVQTLHNYRLLCAGAMLFHEGRVCERCVGGWMTWRGVLHRCYRQSRSASAAVTAMLAAHRVAQTWANKVDIYIALTEFARRKFIEGGLPANRIVVKPHFVYPDPGVGDGHGGYVLLVSRLSAEKGIGTVLEAWRQLRGRVPLRIVGDGPLAAQVVEATRRMPQVQWLGRKPLDEVYPLMREASCLLFPSVWYETFGRVIIEAFSVGTPVIGSRIGVIPELIADGETGLLFEPASASDLANKVEELLSNPKQLPRMRHNARQEFQTKYTAERNYQIMRAIYEAALNGHR